MACAYGVHALKSMPPWVHPERLIISWSWWFAIRPYSAFPEFAFYSLQIGKEKLQVCDA
jgi:hypothetical protein